MGSKNNTLKKGSKSGKSNIVLAITAGIVVVIVAVIIFIAANKGGSAPETVSGDLIIPKSEITQTVKFYPYNANGTKLEILAVKASDGTIRTAFNTCQVCMGSPKAYYKQDGDEVVCQNCGNKFALDMIEQQRGGCNPVPIMKENKTDDGTNIIISKDFIASNKDIFTDNWKTQ